MYVYLAYGIHYMKMPLPHKCSIRKGMSMHAGMSLAHVRWPKTPRVSVWTQSTSSSSLPHVKSSSFIQSHSSKVGDLSVLRRDQNHAFSHDAGRESVTSISHQNTHTHTQKPYGNVVWCSLCSMKPPFHNNCSNSIKIWLSSKWKKNSTLHQKYSNRGKNPGNSSAAWIVTKKRFIFTQQLQCLSPF